MSALHIVTVFGSSRPTEGDVEYEQARELGWALAAKEFTVCTGGYGGVMEAVSRGAKDAGGRTIGITAKFFRAQANRWVDQEISVDTWQARLFELVRRGHGYVACKGGTGTLVELAVVWEMLNKGVMEGKPFVVLGDFWRPIVERVREVEVPERPSSEVTAGPWLEANSRIIQVVATPAAAADFLARRLAAAPPSAAAASED
jgi:uncharacterized protein (TIGR00730 family)